MSWLSNNETAAAGDLVALASTKMNYFVFRLEKGGKFETHRGILYHDDLIGTRWGTEVFSHKGSAFYLLQPTMNEILSTTKRNTQIMYPKDIGFILMKMNIAPGTTVIEAGTGSGGLTQVLALMVGKEGHVYTYERREEMTNLARKNVERLGLDQNVTFFKHGIDEGFEQKDVDVVFLDLPNPYDYVQQVRDALIPGGHFGALLPTTNQVTKLLLEMRRMDFEFVDVVELMLRFYQAEADKFRPVDRMVAHTGYLVFGRPIARSTYKGDAA
ncbi:MAG: tRNA (adenine57-N1/adenine58-N1)-methyltransferase catalytic subunit [Chloroflexota bacterium]|nr:tRNA (adenine57-N1/adenine58-N1)-methyltransferase catalytic subunit [Chloroflexota bacterium]